MFKKALSTMLAATIAVSLIAPGVTYAADIDAPVAEVEAGQEFDNNNSEVGVNNGTITTNTAEGSITTNNSVVGTNAGLVETNTETGSVGANSGAILTNEGNVENNNGITNMDDFDETGDISGGIGVNSGDVTTNNGTIIENLGSITTNNGEIDVNKGAVGTNGTAGVINEMEGQYNPTSHELETEATVTTNNGEINIMNPGSTVTTNGTTGYIGFVGSQVTTNNGEIEDVLGGTVGTNNAQINVLAGRPNPNDTVSIGTVATNASTGVINSVGSDGLVSENEGTVNYNEGVVVNAAGGVVEVNHGGSVEGGTVNINLSHADQVEEANILKQMWQIVSNKLGNLFWQEESQDDIYEWPLGQEQVEVYLAENGAVFITPADPEKEIQSLTLASGTAVIEKQEDGSFKISGIETDIDLNVVFVGDNPAPKPVRPPVDEDTNDDNNNNNQNNNQETPASVVPAALPTTMPTAIPLAPSAIVETLAPVIAPTALYGAVDLNGQPVAISVVPVEAARTRVELQRVLRLALEAAGFDAGKMVSAYTGTISSAAVNSVMTLRVSPNPGALLYVAFRDPITGATTYVKPKINADGTISFEVPFANCEFSIVNVEK